ncbi:MAG: Na/Pi cotransporter family protein [Bacteroidales bacterium]|nr:Na/Pi cotransporter family protein [Bacteroidales bacterium]
MSNLLQVFTLIGALGMFLYGMTLMSEGLQKTAGDKLRSFLAQMTSNRFKRVLTGLGVTALVQSSSATTIMVVSFVNAGLLTLGNAIGVIMGANIGTTLTAWVTALGFSVDISVFSVPLMALGFILHASKKQKNKSIGEFVVGFAIMFLGLSFMKSSAGALLDNKDAMLAFFSHFTGFGFWSEIIFLLAGTILTIVLQASSATMAITMLLTTSGLIDFPLACAMVLGENIGTTITANMAAAVGNTSAKRTARAHTVFNVFGVIWVLIIFNPFLNLVGLVMEFLGFSNPLTVDLTSPDANESLLYGISMLHTLFNIFNTLLLIWFTPLIEKIVVWMVKSPKGEEVFRLKYISGGPLSTAELSLDAAQQEVVHFAEICRNGFSYMRQAVNEQNPDKFEALNDKLIKYEEITDRIEFEIATYVNEVSKNEISEEATQKIKSIYKIVKEMESLGDSGEAIGRILKRKNVHGKAFDKSLLDRLNKMMDLVQKGYDVMVANLKNPELTDISNAVNAEYNIDECRRHLREEHIVNIESNSYNYLTGVYYIDVLNELEKIGDFLINISEAAVKKSNE